MKKRKPVYLSRSVGLLPSTVPLYRDEQLIWEKVPRNPPKNVVFRLFFGFERCFSMQFVFLIAGFISRSDNCWVCSQLSGSSYQVAYCSMALPHAVADGVKECLKKANSGSLAGALGDLLQLLLKEGYAYTQRTNSVHIGCHPSNRDGTGISTSHVQSLASQFFELGFDPSLQRPIAVELQSDDVAIQTWNQELVGLAPVSKPLKFASLSASHTNQVLRSFIHQMPHDDDRLTFNGKMSSQKLKSQDTLYFAAVEEGLKDESHEMMYIYISTVFLRQ